VGAAGLTSIAGCIGTGERENSGSSSDDGDSSSNSQMASEIDGWGWDIAARSLQLTAEEYNAEHDATVQIEEFGRGAMKDRLQTNLVSGSGAPPVAMLESIDAQVFIDTGSVTDLSDRIEEAGIRENFVSGTWEGLSTDDGIYALPWDIGPVAVFYRQDIYDEYDIDPDSIETWDDFIEEGQKLPDDIALLNLPENDLNGVWRYQFRQLGGEPFLESGEVNINSETSLRVARKIKEIYDAGVATNIESWSSSWFTAYGNGDIAALPAGAWMEGTLRAELPDTSGLWGVHLPLAYESGGSRATNWGGSNLMIPNQVSETEAARAWDYMMWTLANEEMQLLMFEEYGLFPALETTYDSDIFSEPVDFFDGQPVREVYASVAPDIPGYRFTADTPEVSAAMGTNLQRMIQGDMTPEEAIQDAAETVAENTGRDLA
jgi:ABC-type sugar transport system, periplasmic component